MALSRMLSVLLAGCYLVIAFFSGEKGSWFIAVSYLVLPLGCIWYGRHIGDFAGLALSGEDSSSPLLGRLIEITGWFLLIVPLVVIMILRMLA